MCSKSAAFSWKDKYIIYLETYDAEVYREKNALR